MEEIELIESLLLDEEFVYEASEFFNANYPLNDDEKYFQLVKEFYEVDSEEFDKLYFSLKEQGYQNNMVFLKLCTLINNEKASEIRGILIDIALDLVNTSTGGGATRLNNKINYKIACKNNEDEFEKILSENSSALIRLKERE